MSFQQPFASNVCIRSEGGGNREGGGGAELFGVGPGGRYEDVNPDHSVFAFK